MTLWFNIVFAWIALILAFLLTVIWGLRLLIKKKKIPFVQTINRTLRKHHKWIGLFMIATALVHGLLSSDKLLSLNWGTANWIVSILLELSFLLRKKLSLKKMWMHLHRALTVVFVAIIVVHIITAGGFIIDDLIAGRINPPVPITEPIEIQYANTSGKEALAHLPSNAPSLPSPKPTPTTAKTNAPTQTTLAEPTPANTYIDGIYQGTGEGFRPDLIVQVEIKDDTIVSVIVISHNEVHEQFWGVPVEVIPQRIVHAQSTDVDIVSGATWTSRGIMDAVDDALRQAKISSQ